MPCRNLLTEWARLLIESLAASGVEVCVLSPGSRSTPFAWAALNSKRLQCEVVADERSAAFVAVGFAKLTGKPALLVCTSGSAPTHYFPGLVEASLADVPLLILTADRPTELLECRAPQTVDQTKLYGDFVRRFFELGMPDCHPDALRALQRKAAQAVQHSRYPRPGPVHLNAPARKPLEPVSADNDVARDLTAEVDALIHEGPVRVAAPRSVPDSAGAQALCARLMSSKRGLFLCGPHLPSDSESSAAVTRLARQLGMPLLVESSSQLGGSVGGASAVVIDRYEWLLENDAFWSGHRPDLLVQFGPPPTSSALYRRLKSRPAPLVVVHPFGFADPSQTANHWIAAPENEVAAFCQNNLSAADARDRAGWLSAWQRAKEIVSEVIRQQLGASASMTEPAAMATLGAGVPDHSLLALGNSLPIRNMDRYCKLVERGLLVLCQRGANGIDGLISGAAGAARASARPTTLVLGDVSFLHDLQGLAATRGLEHPFLIAVIDNHGGRIFEQLPLLQAGIDPKLARAWTTPHHLALERAGALFDIESRRVDNTEALEEAIGSAYERPGASLLVIDVPAHSAAEVGAEVQRHFDAEFAGT